MENNNENKTFSYTYSAKDRAEIDRIRKKYMPQEENKIDQLRRLDRAVTEKGMIVSLIFGIIGALMLGVGMCCAMLWDMMLWGVVIGIVGIVLVIIAYPIYSEITKKQREKIAPEILRLADELMKK